MADDLKPLRVLVAGPESSGTHYTVELLKKNMPLGSAVGHRSLPMTDPDARDQAWWPDLPETVRHERIDVVVLCLRHPWASMKGQVGAGWSRDDEEARAKLQKSYRFMGHLMVMEAVPLVVVTYEGLSTRAGRGAFLELLGWKLAEDLAYVDGNQKYWDAYGDRR